MAHDYTGRMQGYHSWDMAVHMYSKQLQHWPGKVDPLVYLAPMLLHKSYIRLPDGHIMCFLRHKLFL